MKKSIIKVSILSVALLMGVFFTGTKSEARGGTICNSSPHYSCFVVELNVLIPHAVWIGQGGGGLEED